jgi:hypothetical protein
MSISYLGNDGWSTWGKMIDGPEKIVLFSILKI